MSDVSDVFVRLTRSFAQNVISASLKTRLTSSPKSQTLVGCAAVLGPAPTYEKKTNDKWSRRRGCYMEASATTASGKQTSTGYLHAAQQLATVVVVLSRRLCL